MKFVSAIAALSLALAPLTVSAQSTSQNNNQTGGSPTAGGVANAPPAQFTASEIPKGALIVGGLVIVAGIVIGIIVATDNDSAPNTN